MAAIACVRLGGRHIGAAAGVAAILWHNFETEQPPVHENRMCVYMCAYEQACGGVGWFSSFFKIHGISNSFGL